MRIDTEVTGVRVTPGRGVVIVDWDPVVGAAGYLVLRAAGENPVVVDHGGGDLLAIPGPPYADTTVGVHDEVRYAIRPVHDPDVLDAPHSPLSRPVAAHAGGDATVSVHVDAADQMGFVQRPWRDIVGSEHLSLLLSTDEVGGEPMGRGLTAALSRVHRELGVARVRAHGLLGDDLAVYREVDGRPVHDFAGVDAVLDALAPTGLRPVLELTFMPRDLAADPTREVTAAGVSSPPHSFARWGDLIDALVTHLRERVGDDELRSWAVEVWNEPDLSVFWTGTQDEYWTLYDVAALAVRAAFPDLPVGGPATAATHWVTAFLAHLQETGAPCDFVSTHVYGSPPLDLRPLLAAHGRAGIPLLWTEWGPSPTHFADVNDSVLSAAFVARGMRSAAGRVDALAPWVASDHFEELGRPPALVHGGFGLLSIGNLAKPRFWALWMLEQLGPAELTCRLDGDGAGSLVEAWSSLDPDSGRVCVVVWNSTLDQGVLARDAESVALLDRTVVLQVSGLRDGAYIVRHRHLAPGVSDLAAAAAALGVQGWPTEEQWIALRAADHLAELSCDVVESAAGRVSLDLAMVMPSMALVELVPR